jgi:hypothetical protein
MIVGFADRGGWPTTSGDLLYVTSAYEPATTNFYTYPGLRYVGFVPGGLGLCADDSGNVFVVDQGEWNKYSHGGTTPISMFTAVIGSNIAPSIQTVGIWPLP